MVANAQKNRWVYVFVCNSGGDENFLGLYDGEKEINFIPVFRSKDEANDCFLSMPRERGKKYELQAVLFDELHADAENSGFSLVVVDGEGKIVAE